MLARLLTAIASVDASVGSMDLITETAQSVVRDITIYADDAVLEYPQSGERFRGRRNIQGQRGHHPARREFVVRHVRGSGELWITELVITYDGKPYVTVSIMEFLDGKVLDEAVATQAADMILKGAKPLQLNAYKVPMAHALIRRALLKLKEAA